ncbi:MAG: lipopolysaccharide transport system permease protein [Acidobacteriota bacterium]|jgi:lipopolysaccharide transport system permease protein|nr:lipopolysaccharide transport system permease protein [Acidobacteriota bacterium]
MGMNTRNTAGTLGSTAVETTTRSAPPYSLPDEPLVTLQPSTSWAPLDVRDLWTYRELLYFLTWRDVKVRYKQTALGVAWVVMQPLLTTLVFTIFLGRVVRVPSDDIPYPLFVYAGLLPWTFFNSAITSSSSSLVGNAHLITKIYFPRLLIPIAAIAARLLDFFISFIVLIVLMAYYGVGMTRGVLMLPALVAIITLLALGVGMVASALNVRYRDIGVMMPLLLQLWMFASPVVYPMSAVPGKWQRLYSLNPMVGVIEGFRAALLGRGFDWTALASSTAITLALLVYAAFSFRRMETHFADIV